MAGGCRVGHSGGLVAVRLSGFPAGTTDADLQAEVRGAAAALQGWAEQTAAVLLPPAPNISDADGGYVEAWLQLSLVSDPDTLAIVPVTYVPAPRMAAARMSGDGAAVLLELSPSSSLEGSGACEGLVQPGAGSGSLGLEAQCVWENGGKLRVQLGVGATIKPGDSLALVAGNVTDASGVSDAASSHATTVSLPEVVMVPALGLTAPVEVGGCDNVDLRIGGAFSRALIVSAPLHFL